MSSQSSRHALPEGYHLHAYRIDGLLGRGGFGVTYAGTEEHTARRVAIKEYLPAFIAMRSDDGTSVMAAESAAEPDYEWGLDRFRSEARTLISVRHPNIVPVLQYFEANGTGYLVMEYQEGRALDSLLTPDNTLAPEEVDEVFLPLLDGLEVVHKAGYLHRDIKPANIFVRKDGTPVLLDFGAARQALAGHSMSLTSIISEGYAPYEQYESDSPQGPWSDIYAIGATMYRCMTGERPADAPARVASQMRNKADPLTPLSSAARSGYPARQIEAATRALSIREEERPQSLAEFRALLTGGGSAGQPAAAGRPAQSAASGTASDTASDQAVTARPAAGGSRRANWLAIGGGAAAALVGVVVIALAVTLSGGGGSQGGGAGASDPAKGAARAGNDPDQVIPGFKLPPAKTTPGATPGKTTPPNTPGKTTPGNGAPGGRPDPKHPVVRQYREFFLRNCLLQVTSQKICHCRAQYLFSRLTVADVRVFLAYQQAGGQGDMQSFLQRHFKGDAARVKDFMTRLTGTLMGALSACKQG